MMNKFVLRLEGGLGNQLFQYAHAKALQLKYGGTLFFDLHAYNDKQIRSLSLNHFNLSDDVLSFPAGFCDKLNFAFFRLLNRICYKLQKGGHSSMSSYRLFCKLGIFQQFQVRYFNSFVSPLLKSNYISGNWISPKFFNEYEEAIKAELTVKSPLSEESEAMLAQINSCNSVCVHVRLGDYLSPEWKDKLYLCTEDYYQRAIDLISSKVEDPVFFVFSNRHKDIEWLKENYHLRGNIVYVDLSNPDYADLKLMYSCKHFIMSNSTYSWWAQYLGSDANKIVVAPSRFNNVPEWDMTDIYQDNWLLIDV